MIENQAHSHLVINSPTITLAVTAKEVLKIISVQNVCLNQQEHLELL